MPTLNDILTANGDYTPVSGYPVDDKYEDDSPVINVYDRTIGEIIGDTSTSGENVSQYLTFRIPRHPDHYDLIENGTNIRILYRLEDDTGEDVVPVNVVANEDYIIFGWKIPLVVTVNPGVVTFIIHAYKSENNLITYHYKTLPKTYTILETMETDVVVPEIEMYNLAEAYARGTVTDVFGQTRPVEEGEPGYHDNSKYYKELAGTSKTDAETAKNAAEAAQEAAEEARQAAEDARDQAVAIVGGEYVSYGQTQSLNDTQKAKARENIEATGPNGYYPNMTVGLSENFVGTGEPTRRVFDYDTAGGSADISDGNAEIEKMYGDTIVWNQWVKSFIPNNGWGAESGVTVSFEDGVANIATTITYHGLLNHNANIVSGHKYYIACEAKTDDENATQFVIGSYGSTMMQQRFEIVSDNIWRRFESVKTASSNNDAAVAYPTVANSYVMIRNYIIVDLTQMFGAGNEPATVEEFKAMFPLDYYPYNSGTLLNVNPAGIKTVGFNAYDKATGKASLIGGNQYQITGTYTSLSYSTGEVLTPDSNGCFTATKTGELTVTGGGANTCVHLTWSGYRNGDYEDYWTRTRDINIQPYFPDGLKRAGTVYDEISKDMAIKRIGVVDLGSLDWIYVNTYASFYCISNLPIKLTGAYDIAPNILCARYATKTQNDIWNRLEVTGISLDANQDRIYINDTSYTDATAFKTAMSGVYLYYELAEPVETPIDPPLNLLYQVSDFGTEQFIGAGATEPKTLPVIADIVYDANYRDTIKNLPKNYAKVSGYYPDLYTGLADNLIDRKGNGTPQEISYRTSCGDDSIADDGNGIIQSIFGKTVVWNQLVQNGNFADGLNNWMQSGDGAASVTDGVLICSLQSGNAYVYQPINAIGGHKYLFKGFIKASRNIESQIAFGGSQTLKVVDVTTSWAEVRAIAIRDGDSGTANFNIIRVFYQTEAVDISVKNVILIDLTQMFGSGNEPTTVDDPRIEWIKDYASAHPEYNSGELISYNGSGIKTVGFNQWDEEWEVGDYVNGEKHNNPRRLRNKNRIKVVAGATYYVRFDAKYNYNSWIAVPQYDADGNHISDIAPNVNHTFTVANNCHYISFYTSDSWDGQTYTGGININLSWSGYRNGEYEPYWSRTLALPISTYFPDGMKSAGSVRDEMTKDKAVKRIGEVTYTGGFLPNAISGDYLYLTYANDDLPVCTNDDVNVRCVSDLFTGVSASNRLYNKNTICVISDKRFMVCVSTTDFADANAFNTYLSNNPVTIYYELAEPIETAVTPPLDLTYKVADFGTEESIAEGKSTPFNGIIKYSDDFTRGLVNMPKNYDTTVSLDALATSLSTMLTSALDGTVTITRGAYDPATKKYAWSCTFTENQSN